MNETRQTLPPLLERQLADTLRRFRRLRLLRAGARFLLIAIAALAAAVTLAAMALPLPGGALPCGLGAVLLWAAVHCFGPVVRRPPSLREIAAHIDSEHPELQDRLLSAVALTEGEQPGSSTWMLEHLLSDTQYRVKGIALDDFMSPFEYRLLAVGVGVCGLLVVAGGLAALWRTGLVRNALESGGRQNTAIEFTVEPGNAVVHPGENQIILVTSPDVNATRYIYWEQEGEEHSAVMASSSSPEVSYYTFEALQTGLRYRVQVGQTGSDPYEIVVSRPPAVISIQLQYTYPEYLAMEPKVVPFGGDIAAVEGTRVAVRVEATPGVETAQLVRTPGEAEPMESLGGDLFEASFELQNPGQYHLALLDGEGVANVSPDEYAIEVYRDKPPEIRVRFPRGDDEVLAIEEVPLAFEVKDDFGIANYGIAYTVAGREPVRVALHGGQELLQEVAGSHLLALEDLGLSSGDLITWSIWADDRKPDRAAYEGVGDPYFLEVRPYVRRYRENITEGGGEGASGEARDILEDQRGVVISIHHLRKAAGGMGEETYGEDAGRIVEAQKALREGLEGNIGTGMVSDSGLAAQAITAMEEVELQVQQATWPAPEDGLGEALVAAQEALQTLIKLEPSLRTVTRTQGSGGGGGGGSGTSQGEIDALELSKRKDYQEDARTGAAEAQEREAIRKGLEDLARRQEILNDDLAKLLSEDEQAMTEEERKRQLERLREEQERQLERLDDLANRLAQSQMGGEQRQAVEEAMQDARQSMETSLEEARRDALQQARASGSRAGQHLSQAEAGLEQFTREAARARMEALEEELAMLEERQQGVLDEIEGLKEDQSTPGVDGQQELAERAAALTSEKRALAESTRDMLEGAGGLSDQLREHQELLSRKLGDWVRRTSRTGVVEDMEREQSQQLMEFGAWDALRGTEERIHEKLSDAADTLKALRQYLPGEPGEEMARALDMLNQLEGLAPSGEEQPGPGQSADGESPGAGEPTPAAGIPPGSQPGEGTQTAQRQGASAGADSGGPPTDAGGPPSGGEGDGSTNGGGSDVGGRGGLQVSENFQGGDSALGDFFDQDISDWRPLLQDAASLLPRESPVRGSLEQVEMELGRLQREYNNGKKLPDPGEFEQVVRRPLKDAIDTLEDLVRADQEGDRQWLQDEGAVPSQYADRVADYTRALAEQQGVQ